MISHLQLTTIKTLSHSSSLKEDETGFQFIEINHPHFDAAFSLHGGHLIHFQPNGKPAIIWTSKTAIYNNEKAIRGGVPICWPWFGAAGDKLGSGLPAHGIVRTSDNWLLGEINESTQGVELNLHLNSTPETKAIWPFDFNLTLRVTLSNSIKLELITENTGDLPFTYRAALHSYLNISDVTNVNISGLSHSSYNGLTQQRDNTNGHLIIDQAIDSIYDKAPQKIILKDSGFNHELSIENVGNDSEVLWSPWIEGAKAFADMPDDGFKTMFCIESGITDIEGVTVQPKAKHILSTHFTTEL